MDEEQRRSLYQNPLRHLLSHQIFKILQNGPAHGYQIMLDVERDTGGCWRPSTAMVYRVLAEMETRGFLTSTEEEVGDKTRRVYRLTTQGRQAAGHAEQQFAEFIDLLVRPALERGGKLPGHMLYVLLSPPGRKTLEQMPPHQRLKAVRQLAELLRIDLEWLEGLLADAGNTET